MFRYRLDNSDLSGQPETTNTSFTQPTNFTSGDTHRLYVQERDTAGNWSNIVSHRITVDNVYPTLTDVRLEGLTHPDDTTDVYTRTEDVTVYITASVASEAGRPTIIEYYDYNPSGWKQWPTPIYSDNPSISVTLPATNGERRVYVRLIDEAGNTTSYIYDTIILDTEDPVVNFSINNGDSYTPSLSFYLTLDGTSDNISDVSELEVMTYNPYGSGWQPYRPFSTSLISDFDWPTSAGSKYTYVALRDAAGNVTSSVYDSITLQVPEPNYAQKGKYSSGTSYVYFNPVTEPSGTDTTIYYLYSTTEANADPNDTLPGDWTYEYGTTSTSSIYSNIPKGEIRYFFIRAYNPDSGGYGPWTTTNTVFGFSSNITLVYNDDSSSDITRANDIKSFLEDTYYGGGLTSHPNISGTMPTWTVTLLPEDLISNSYSSDDTHRIYGDPIIITPGTSFEYNSSIYDGKVRNMAASNKGIVGMWLRGMYVLDRIERNWSAWGLSGTRPTQIGYKTPTETLKSYSTGNLNSMKKTAASVSESIWHSPLSHSALGTESTVTLTGFTTSVNRWGANIPGSVIDGYKYAASPSYSTRFPVVRQGRFLQYGYQEIPKDTSWRYGDVFFVNLIARMDNF